MNKATAKSDHFLAIAMVGDDMIRDDPAVALSLMPALLLRPLAH